MSRYTLLLAGCMVCLVGARSDEGLVPMRGSLFESIPLWLVLVATCGFILLTIEAGFRVGVIHARRSEDAREAAIDALVGSTLGLLAFMLAFTF